MSLESKAKTTKTIADLCDNCTTFCGDCPNSAKWVSLEDAQKVVDQKNKEWQNTVEQFEKTVQTNLSNGVRDLQAKIDEYRKWLFYYLPKVYNQIESEGWIVSTASQQAFVKLFGELEPEESTNANQEMKK